MVASCRYGAELGILSFHWNTVETREDQAVSGSLRQAGSFGPSVSGEHVIDPSGVRGRGAEELPRQLRGKRKRSQEHF